MSGETRGLAHPAHWPSWLLVALMWLAAHLPLRAQRGIGRGIGRAALVLAPRRRRIAEANLALCFADRDDAARASLLRANFEATGIATVETASAWFRDPGLYADRLELIGDHHLRAAIAAGRGVLLAGCHMVTLEICGALLSTVTEIDVVQRRHGDPVLDRMQQRGRSRCYGAVIERGDLRGLLRSLRAGRCVWYAADQDPGRGRGVFVPFFGIATATLNTTARLARISGARVLVLDHWRDPATGGWTLRFSAPLEDFGRGDATDDTARLSRAIEDAVMAHPEQYLWTHRRFKTRPGADTDPYA